MRLLNINTLRLESYNSTEDTPPYAILSHTWEEEEVLFEDLQEKPDDKTFGDLQSRFEDLQSHFINLQCRFDELNDSLSRRNKDYPSSQQRKYPKTHLPQGAGAERTRSHTMKKKGWSKIEGCRREAAKFGIDYVWIDTCCINKESSAELSEAINSMFAWYRDARLCFAYLSDAFDIHTAFGISGGLDGPRRSKWFSRGWTLQELVAPKTVLFYQRDWVLLGPRSHFADHITEITRIPQIVLKGRLRAESSSFSVATKMSWAADRKTTRPEDRAYSLMGLFAVNMPTIYGEGGQSAIFRLQTEIFNASGDHSIFAWSQGLFRLTQHPKIIKSDPSIVDSYVRDLSPSDLLVSNLDLFAPRPLHYPNIENAPYDLKSLNVKDPTHANSLARYSASSHGMRVQVLLEPFLEVGTGRHIFIAHLACTIRDSTSIVGIYVYSERPGQYRRIYPKILISIDRAYHAICPLTVEDIYITPTQLDWQAEPSRRDLWGWKHEIRINLADNRLERSGFTLRDYKSTATVFRDNDQLILKVPRYPGVIKRDEISLIFQNKNLEGFGIILNFEPDKIRVSVKGNIDPHAEAAEIMKDSELQDYEIYYPSQEAVFCYTQSSGNHVVVEFSRGPVTLMSVFVWV